MAKEGPLPRYKRILLKVSGEVLMGPNPFGFHPETINRLAEEVVEASALGVRIGIVVGGGNIFRGNAVQEFDRPTADMVGMLATVMNGLVLQEAIERRGVSTRVLSAIQMPQVCEMFIRRRALRHLEKGRVIIFVGGTGHPYFSTDTGAVLRALEISAEAILKGTKVDGVYSADPVTVPFATFYKRLSYEEAIARNLRVMDQTAITLCKENRLPIHVFNIRVPGNIKALLMGEEVGTLIAVEA